MLSLVSMSETCCELVQPLIANTLIFSWNWTLSQRGSSGSGPGLGDPEKEGKIQMPWPPLLPASGAKATDPDLPIACQGQPSMPFQLSGLHSKQARGPWKASSLAHYQNLIWIPRDQEALVESGCHKGRDAEAKANPSQLIFGTSGLSWSSGPG